MFSADMNRFKAFRGVSLNLYRSHWLGKVLIAFRHSGVFRFFLRRSHELWAVLKGSWRFWGALWHSGVFCGEFWCVVMVLKGPWRSQTFPDAFGCSEAFWGVVMGSERFWKTLWSPVASFYIVSRSEAFSLVVKGSLRLWGVVWLYGVFCLVQYPFNWFWVVLKDSRTFWSILWGFEDAVRHPDDSDGFLVVLKCSWMF